MSTFFRKTVWLVMVMALCPSARASWIIYNYNVRSEWIRNDFIGWVRVEEVLAVPTSERAQAKVRLKVIERLKGEKTPSLQLVYRDQYFASGKEDDIVRLGSEQRWREQVGREFLVFLKQGKDGTYEAEQGYYFSVVDGWLLGLPQEYTDYLGLSGNPHTTEFLAAYRACDLNSKMVLGEPLLVAPLRLGRERVETPRQRVEMFIAALLGNRRREAEQMFYRTRSYATPAIVWQPDSINRKAFARIEVTWEAVLGNRALVELWDRQIQGEPELWYLIFEGKQWRLLDPSRSMAQNVEELAKWKRDGDFRILTETWKKLRPTEYNSDPDALSTP